MNAFFDIDEYNKANYPNLATELDLKNFGSIDTVAEHMHITPRLLHSAVWGCETLTEQEWTNLETWTTVTTGGAQAQYLRVPTIQYVDLTDPGPAEAVIEVWRDVEEVRGLITSPYDIEDFSVIPTLDEVLSAGVMTLAGMRYVLRTARGAREHARWRESTPPVRDIQPGITE